MRVEVLSDAATDVGERCLEQLEGLLQD